MNETEAVTLIVGDLLVEAVFVRLAEAVMLTVGVVLGVVVILTDED